MILVYASAVVMFGALVIAVVSHVAHNRRTAALHRQSRYQFGEPLEPNNLVVLPTQRTPFEAHAADALDLANEVNR